MQSYWIVCDSGERFLAEHDERHARFTPFIGEALQLTDEEALCLLERHAGCFALRIDNTRPSVSVKIRPSLERVHAAGQAELLTLMIAMMISLVLLAGSVSPILAARRAENQWSARAYTATVLAIETQLALCAASNSCPNTVYLTAQIPQPGQWVQQGYAFSFTQAGNVWSLQATPTATINGTASYYASSAGGLVLCGTTPAALPC